MPDHPPACSLCGQPVEPWPSNDGEVHGWGHNPEPLADVNDRCCNTCNATKVIPARLINFKNREN